MGADCRVVTCREEALTFGMNGQPQGSCWLPRCQFSVALMQANAGRKTPSRYQKGSQKPQYHLQIVKPKGPGVIEQFAGS